MKAGDYALQGFEHVCIIERKSGIGELANNTDESDRARFLRAFERLKKECAHPILLIEQTLTDLLAPHARIQNPGTVLDEVLSLTIDPTIPILSVRSGNPLQKRLAGELVARVLIQAALKEIHDGIGNRHD